MRTTSITRNAFLAGALASSALLPRIGSAADFEDCWGAYEASKWAEAATCFESVASSTPDWAWVHHYLGVSYHGQGKLDQAVASFEKAMELMAADPEPGFDPYYMAAQVLDQKGQHRKAMDALVRGEGYVTPEQRPDFLALRGRISYALGNHAKAVEDLKKSGRDDFDALYALGVAAYQAEDFATSTDALEKALKARPEDASTANFLALAFFRRAEATPDAAARDRLYARSADVGKSMLAANPSSVEAHNLLGRALLGAGKLEEAETHFQKVLSLKPGHCFAQANLAQLYSSRKQWDRAIDQGGKALACLPQDAKRDVHLNLGFAHSARGKAAGDAAAETDVAAREKAIASYQKALEHFEAADAIRSSAATKTQVDIARTAIAGFQENIGTIRRNQDASAANEASEAAAREAEERRKALEKARGGSGG